MLKDAIESQRAVCASDMFLWPTLSYRAKLPRVLQKKHVAGLSCTAHRRWASTNLLVVDTLEFFLDLIAEGTILELEG